MPAMNEFNPLRDAIPLRDIKRVLVIKLRHHGDVLLTSPLFAILKDRLPEAEIDALVYADTAEMLSLHPAISRLHLVDRNWKRQGPFVQLKEEWALLRALKVRKYDLIFHLTEHWRGAWLCRLLKPRYSVGPVVEGRSRRWHGSFSHHQGVPRSGVFRHTVESNLDALRRVGIQSALKERSLLLIPGNEAETRVKTLLAELGLELNEFIHIHPASRWFFKCWPPASMAALISLFQDAGYRVLLTAAPSRDELSMVDTIQARLKRPACSLAGQLSLKELAVVSGLSRLFVGVDSAPMHIAAAMGTPVVAIFGPSGDMQWGPWGVPSRVVTSKVHACRPCGIDGCGGGKVSDCLHAVTVAEVFEEALSLLDSLDN